MRAFLFAMTMLVVSSCAIPPVGLPGDGGGPPATTAPPTTAVDTTVPDTTVVVTTVPAPTTTAAPTTVPAPTTTAAPTTTVAPTTTTTTVPATTTTTTTTTTMPPMQPFPVPAPGVGSPVGGTLARGSIQRPSADGTGNFRIVCWYSHMNYDDSIIFPGQPGRAHLHTYFGNLGSNANSTPQSLLTSGNSTCDGGTLNRSSYWVPAMINAAGQVQIPSQNMIYYKSGYQGVVAGTGKDRITLPNGIKIIAGSASATSPQFTTTWRCSAGGVTSNNSLIPVCPGGSTLTGTINFPQCWDGINLDSPNHQSHMAYGQFGSGCPASHPVPLPAISYNVDWRVPAGQTSAGWFVSSDMGRPGGTTFHADIITAWDPATRDTWLSNCTRQNADCGVGTIADGVHLMFPVR